ncbi:PDR/VanB family oxidoreductase [Pseudonocardia sp. NPDC049154]|uniref:PDR/VanB family oxidoreductase n=1 Tax=Pseudonocardia sp. NPDC049154 TaxID=3155501 RepID=UPI0033E1B58E
MPEPLRKVRVDRIVDEAEGVRSFRLVGLDGDRLPPATPGSHVDVQTPGGPIRQYSLCDPDDHVIAVKLEAGSRGGSAAMHRVEEGDVLEIGAPRNAFGLVEEARRHVLVAGGIGITPVLAMARHLARRGAGFELHYFARSEAHMAFREVITEGPWRGAAYPHVGLDPDGTCAVLRAVLREPTAGVHVYTCGPGPLMDAVRAVAQGAGWAAEQLHEERFSAAPVEVGASGFRVELARSGIAVEVGAAESVLDALGRAGIEIDYSCEQGICGTCVTPVLAGDVDHRDDYLTDEEKAEGDRMCVCVSRCRGERLQLDL